MPLGRPLSAGCFVDMLPRHAGATLPIRAAEQSERGRHAAPHEAAAAPQKSLPCIHSPAVQPWPGNRTLAPAATTRVGLLDRLPPGFRPCRAVSRFPVE